MYVCIDTRLLILSTMGVLLSTEGKALLVSGLAVALYCGYRAALPKPLPGIPYNQDASHKLLGDMPEMIRYVMRTKRVFVCHQIVPDILLLLFGSRPLRDPRSERGKRAGTCAVG